MVLLREREGKLIQDLKELIYSRIYPIKQYRMIKTKTQFEHLESINTEHWEVMTNRQLWGGHRENYYFETVITVPSECEGKPLVYELRTGQEGGWDALNPQFLAYVNERIVQGLDVNHREILLTECAHTGEEYRIILSAYTGDHNFSLLMDSEYKVLEREVEHYYYDISVPFEVAKLLPRDSAEYIEMIQCLNQSLNLLDLRKKYSPEFYDSLAKAQEYITEEFYKKMCGIHYFMTTKISWNKFNKMPYDTFLWEGIDGTKVLTHFSPSRDYWKGAIEGSAETEHFTTYNAMLNPSQIKGNWQRYSQKDLHTDTLMSFGYGDGGGGPTVEMLENCRRLEQGIPGSPRAKQSHALEFFQNLEKAVTDNPYLPKWVGELYLEYHRGTYTSMARNKKFNRRSEFACENLEFYSVLGKKLLKRPYPQKELNEIWEIVLRNQFHDILPGSSILEVYEDSQKEYEHVLSFTEQMTREILEAVAEHVDAQENDIVLFNPNDAKGPAPVLIPCSCIANDTGSLALCDGCKEYPLQKTSEGYIAVLDEIPVRGYCTYQTVKKEVPENQMIRSQQEVDTPYFHVVINEAGQFTSIYDKSAGREIIPQGKVANQIVTYEDKPHNFDAWDINNYYTEKSWEVNEVSNIEILEDGPIRACIRIERAYLDSKIVQYLYFYQDLYRIDIRNEIDWKEAQILVRDYFPVDIHTNEAVFEIQYGNVKRATHSNTMWDFAKFEVCAHKWLDVSEAGYGVSMLNDCKYGCSVKDGVIGLTMLKSALYPNPEADKEHHTFWYSICPHEDDFRAGHTVEKAYLFNNPLTAVVKKNVGGCLSQRYSYVTVQEQNAVIEVVKQAERSEHTVIRLYECQNRRGKITLTVQEDFKEAWESDMLENTETKLKTEGNTVFTDIMPYEIKTIVLIGG